MNVEAIVRELIDKSIHLSLGTSKNGQPWVCELHFAYDDELNLYFRSLTSRRHSQEIADNPLVAGNVVHQHSQDEYPSGLYFEGTATLLTELADQEQAAKVINQRLSAGDGIVAEAQNPGVTSFIGLP